MPAPGLAVAQTQPAAGDVVANVKQHIELAKRAAGAGADCVVFPELSLTGYEIEAAPSLAFALDDERLDDLRACAQQHACTLLVGAPVRLEGKLHLSQLILDPGGSVEIYTKQRLGTFSESARQDGTPPPGEPTVFAPGTADPRLALEGGIAALAICADIAEPNHARRAAASGATHYLASMFVIPSELEGDLQRLAGFASGLGMLVAFANYVGSSGGLHAAGQSAIWSPGGDLLVQLGSERPGVAVALNDGDTWVARAL